MSIGVGEVVAGYRLTEPLHSGANGELFLAEDTGSLHRTVVVKVFPLDPAWDETAVLDRYRRIAMLEHPDILPIYALEANDGVVYLVIRYVPGGDLATSLSADGPLPVARADRLVSQIASGLDAAHAAGIVHGDVKPSNILLGEGGRVFLADFSPIAPGTRDPGGAGQILGTIDYMAPEIATGGPVDGRADTYALGCVLFQCLTGRVPFAAPDALGVLWAHQHEPPPSAVALRPDLDASLDAVLAKAMAKAPGDRFGSAGELADAFALFEYQGSGFTRGLTNALTAAPAPRIRPFDEARVAAPRPVETSITTAVHETLLDEVDAVGTVEPNAPPVLPAAPAMPPTYLARDPEIAYPTPKASSGLGRITTWFGRGRGAGGTQLPRTVPAGDRPAMPTGAAPPTPPPTIPPPAIPPAEPPARVVVPPDIDWAALAADAAAIEPAAGTAHAEVDSPVPARSDVDLDRAGDTVDCSVHAPPTVLPASTFLVQVWAHLVDQAPEAERLAQTVDPDARLRIFKTLEVRIPRGSRLELDLTMPGLEVIDSTQSIIWGGRPQAAGFEVRVPRDRTIPTKVIGTVGVIFESVPIGHLKFTIAIGAGPSAARPVGDDARRYHKAFVSYSSADRDKVLQRVQMLAPLGIEYFLDLLNLEAGERWETTIYERIDGCDLFLLFWSDHAKTSDWVHREVRHAIERKAHDDLLPPEIRPIVIEGPPVPKPWAELAHLHFNDGLLYFMEREGR